MMKLPGGRPRTVASALAIIAVAAIVAGCGESAGKATAANGKTAASHNGQATTSHTTVKVEPAAASVPLGSGEARAGAGNVVPIVLQRDDKTGIPGTITGRPEWPRFAPSKITIPKGKTITLIITNYDDMMTPLPEGLRSYDNVQGGTETVDGKTVTSVSNKMIAHTFTVPQLGVNVPVPMAPKGGSVTVTFTFTATKSGTFKWQCYAPCGSGKDGNGGSMATEGYMAGTVIVT